jgi:hypothetical protein
MVKRFLFGVGLLLTALVLYRLGVGSMALAQAATFPDAHDAPPAGWAGPVFHLRQDYPSAPPAAEVYPWKAVNFRTRPLEYLNRVREYAFAGNTAVDFDPARNALRAWYHAPWMHAGNNGREFIHGLTKERGSRKGELDPNQDSNGNQPWENWAVSVYNAAGGHVIGQVWRDPQHPDPAAARFPDGTLAVKLLFTQAPVSQVPYLQGSIEWLADTGRVTRGGSAPEVLRLLQMDVAVRDSRANASTGWVFGTYVYDAQAPGASAWERMVPLGLMWGNDPTRLAAGSVLKQTWINPAVRTFQHLGQGGRLNGPVDNPASSCLSCHARAQVSSDLGSVVDGSDFPPANPTLLELKKYFRNIKAGAPFTAGAQALDYSLQLRQGILNRP